jgi:predicted nucleotide-binding protein (sugar kinase/HSP70/actin superfamily)
MVVVLAFGCGPNAVVMESLQVLSSRYCVPLVNLGLDKNGEEACFVTRVELLVAMLERWVVG